MTPELAIKMAQHETDGEPIHKQMEVANTIFEINGGICLNPFSQDEIVFAEFLDELVAKGTQRERDLVFISHRLQSVYKTLYISINVLQEPQSETSIYEIDSLVSALKRQNLIYLLHSNKLSKYTLKWLKRNNIQLY